MGARPVLACLVAMIVAVLAPAAANAADDVVHVGNTTVDRPTLITLGMQMQISGDDNHNAQVAIRYRPAGAPAWRAGAPLFRVHPEDSLRPVPEQFAGSIFELTPGTTYEVELRATDPDGPVDQTVTLSATTRDVPAADPQAPQHVTVNSSSSLQSALDAAQPGDVIDLAGGTYDGQFVLDGGGTAANPIVIRGAGAGATVLDGRGCSACNVLEAYGSFVHVESLTLQNANRGIRFQGVGAQANVLRGVRIRDTRLGVGSRDGQRDFYICDNAIEGRLAWPKVYTSDNGSHSDDDGINVVGEGHVVCHNRISGFGDAMKIGAEGARANDFYGNEVNSSYDNAIEFDYSDGNVRAFRNRFTNTFSPISFQPVNGGPVYAFRNVAVNITDEPLKFHGLGMTPPPEPNGVLVFNNTFVKAGAALHVHTDATSHHFVLNNNLFVGTNDSAGRVVDWTAPIEDGSFDHNGWAPDGRFDFDDYGDWPSFAALQASAAFETHGVLLNAQRFASGLAPPASYKALMPLPDATLSPLSNALDAGTVLANVTDGFSGPGPDLGALERGCPAPIFGVRPAGIDETNEPYGCGGPAGIAADPFVAIQTTALTLKDQSRPPASPGARKLLFKSSTKKDSAFGRITVPPAGGGGDPTLAGATLTVYNSAGSGQKAVVPLAAGGWTGGSKGYTFRGGAGGPIKSVVVRADQVIVNGGGASWPYALDAPAQGSVAVRLTLGTAVTWCASAPGRGSSDHVDLFVAVTKTPAPSSCPVVP